MPTKHDFNIDRADILIVDDESANLKLLSDILGRQGFHVRPANSPRLAIDSAFGKPPDLILLDIRMPEMDGFEVCATLKQDERTHDVPILFISALQDTQDKVRAFEVGGVDFITKPFQEEEVLSRVRTHLKLHNMQRNLEDLVAERTLELAKSEHLARTLLNATTDMTHLIDEDGTILDLNDAMAERLGGTREELLGTCVFDLFPPEAVEARRKIVRQALLGGKPIRYVDRLRPGIVYEVGVYPVETSAGEKGRIVIFTHDITEREQHEQELQKSRDYFEHLINSIPDAVFSMKLPERTINWANDSYNVLGYNFAEYIGKTTEQFYGSIDEYQAIGESLKNAIRDNKDTFITEVIVQKSTGEFIPAEINTTIYREKGKAVSSTSLVRDITFRKKAQAALESSEARLKEAQRIALIGSWELYIPTNTLTWSDEIFRIFEIDPNHFGANYEAFLDAIHPDDRDVVDKAYTQSLKNRRPYKIDHRLLMPDGRIKYVHEQSETEYSPEGKPLRSVGTVQDITERKLMERALKKNEERLRSAQEIARLGYWEWDLDTGRLTWSDEVYRIYGIDPGTPVTSDVFSDRVHPDDQDYRRQLINDLLDGKTVPPFTYRIVRPDGSVRYIYGMKLLERDEHGSPSRIKGTLQDVTQGKTVEMAYHDSEARLKKAQAETMNLRLEMAHLNRIMTMNELAASFAHEINQPLGAIVNNASVAKVMNVQSAQEREEFTEILEDIAADAQRAGQIIRKLRGVMKKGDAVLAFLDVNLLLDEVLAMYQNSFSLDHVSVVLEKEPDLVPVKGDRIRLQQVLMNLITNAMDAMADSPQKSLTFKTSQSEGIVYVSVGDKGAGIEQCNMDQIFDAFYTTKSDGMGIGLRLCKSIIEEHGGRIWAEKNHDAGITFYFTLKEFSG